MASFFGLPRKVPQSVAEALAPAHKTSLHTSKFPFSPPFMKVLPSGQCLVLLLAAAPSATSSAA